MDVFHYALTRCHLVSVAVACLLDFADGILSIAGDILFSIASKSVALSRRGVVLCCIMIPWTHYANHHPRVYICWVKQAQYPAAHEKM